MDRCERLLFLIVNDKGGVGKSTVTALVNSWHLARGRNPKLYDTDTINRTLKKCYPEAELLDTNDITNIDVVVNGLDERRLVLLDNKAGGMQDEEHGFLKWLGDVDLFEWAGEHGIGLTFGAVVNQNSDNNDGIGRILEEVGDRVKWVVFRNFIQFKDTSIWDDSPIRERAIDLGAVGITVPCIEKSLVTEMERQKRPLEGLKLRNAAEYGRRDQLIRKFYLALDEIAPILAVGESVSSGISG